MARSTLLSILFAYTIHAQAPAASISAAASCEAAWPKGIATLLKAGMRISSSDRAGGLLQFKGPTDGFIVEFSPSIWNRNKISPTEQLFRGYVADYRMSAAAFNIQDGVVLFSSVASGCEMRLSLKIVGYFEQTRGFAVLPLESNGKLERQMLAAIEREIQ